MSSFNLTEKQIKAWGGVSLYNEAEKQYTMKGDVLNARYEEPYGEADIAHAGSKLHTRFKVSRSGLVENLCPCAVSQRDGRVCVHIVAAAIVLNKRATAAARIPEKALEKVVAEKVAAAAIQGKLITRDYRKGQPAEIRLRLPADWTSAFAAGQIPLICTAVLAGGGNPISLEYIAQRGIALNPGRIDDTILYVLEDIRQGDMTKPVTLTRADFMGLLDLLGANKRPFYVSNGEPLRIEQTALASKLAIDLDRETGEILMMLTTEVPGTSEGTVPTYAVFGKKGYAFHNGVFWPLKSVLPGLYQKVYLETVPIPRKGTLSFLRKELDLLEQLLPVERLIEIEMFTMRPATPKFSLKVKGTPAAISMTLFALYDDVSVSASAPDPRADFAIPDPVDFFMYGVRNPEAEKAGIARLRSMGIPADSGTAISPLVGERAVLNFLGSTYPALERIGWAVLLDDEIGHYYSRLRKIYTAVEVEQAKGASSFEIGYSFKDVEQNGKRGTVIQSTEVQRAVSMNESFVKRGEQVYLFDTVALRSLREALQDCDSTAGVRPGFVRISTIHAPYIKASLDAVEGAAVQIDKSPPEWRVYADVQNRQRKLEPVPLDEPLRSIMRPYQKEGLAWLRFLEANKLGGILADEMGLGKTLQALAWLQLERIHAEHRGKPAIVICPTSLVDNWAHEAAHFTPELKVLTMSGAQRHENFELISTYDLVITSYALLRRDVDEYHNHVFSSIILDEAQNIKNRATQNATSVKMLTGGSHFVLTGTPMENSVADLWSIMDFLLPGYLGLYQEFRENYEIPLSVPGDAVYESAQIRLRRKLHPFLLRRRKADVAKDLPPKIVRFSWSKLTGDQQEVYDRILNHSQTEIRSMVKQKGFDKSRMAILTALLRLRQVCCHLSLLGDVNPLPHSTEPSAKLEQFFELFDQAVSDGHRILVFSQFVKMLTALRKALDERGIPYCYLDGSSKNRMESVHTFNTDASIPLFLISLKAGGTGLNLTGADMVIHFDPWWNPAVEDQATDRAHRIGQKNTVYSIKMITSGTVEEKVLDLQRRKRALIGATVESDQQTISKLTWDDMRELFDL